MYVGWVGDSRAVMISYDDKNRCYKGTDLTKD